MTRTIARTGTLWVCTLVLPLFTTGVLAACSDLLTVPEDPTAITDADVNDAGGAELLRRAALFWQTSAVATGAFSTGLLTDEFMRDGAPVTVLAFEGNQALLDMRQSELYEQNVSSGFDTYNNWQSVRRTASIALPKLDAYAPAEVRSAYMGQMHALRGFAALRLAEYICPGFALYDVVDYDVIATPPLSTEQALERALADFDTALSLSADSVRILNFARVGRARTLLNLGRFADAAAAVAGVPTGFTYLAEYSAATFQDNPLSPASSSWGTLRSVSDREGGNGLDFVSANDPRVQTTFLRIARDGATRLYGVSKYPTTATSIVVASGVEARLIEAEAALKVGDFGAWLAKLNELRQTAITPALANATDPGTPNARVDLTFRERAFWLFATGSRLGDLRRLIRQYGRSSESVFPSGAYRRGDVYGTATSIPFPLRLEAAFNPALTGCTSR